MCDTSHPKLIASQHISAEKPNGPATETEDGNQTESSADQGGTTTQLETTEDSEPTHLVDVPDDDPAENDSTSHLDTQERSHDSTVELEAELQSLAEQSVDAEARLSHTATNAAEILAGPSPTDVRLADAEDGASQGTFLRL